MRVFISRDLDGDSPFRRILAEAGFEVIGRSLLQFVAIEFATPPPADWVFCYSSRSVDFFLQGMHTLGLPADRYPHYAAIGPGTAQALQRHDIRPAFVGDGNPEVTAGAFLQRAHRQRVLFPRAEQSRQSVQRLLQDEVTVLDLVVYRNSIREDIDLPPADFVVLTSPLNARAYMERRQGPALPQILAIGATTAGALRALGLTGFGIAPKADEQSLAEAILTWKSNNR